MKKILFLLVSMSAFTLPACMDDSSDIEKIENEATTVQTLNVPASFDWKTTGPVICNVISAKHTLVTVATSATEKPFASFYAGGTAEVVELSIPKAVKTLFMSYKTAVGMSAAKAVAVVNGAIDFTVGDDCVAPAPKPVPALAKTRGFDDPDSSTEDGVVYIPAKNNGWGTILFEDLWPSYGDYDFNDMVANYKMQLYLTENNKVEAMVLGVRIKAIGGSFPNELYLQMTGSITSDMIGDIVLMKPTTSGATLEQVPSFDEKKNRTFFRFAGMRDNKKRPAGSIYLNTEQDKEIADADMVELHVGVYFTQEISLSKFTFTAPDFFIMRKDKNDNVFEIHCRDFEPVFRDAYNKVLTDASIAIPQSWYNSSDATDWEGKVTNKNLVWGLNIPADIHHIYESQNFLEAYPQFKGWVESNGTQNTDWYEHGVKSKLVYEK